MMLLIINSLGGRHTHTHTHTDVRTETILRNQARAWFKIMTMALVLDPVTWLIAHSLYTVLNSKVAWCQKLILTPEALEIFGS